MTRLDGPERPGLLARAAYWMCKRKVGRVVPPVTIHAHHPRLLRGLGGMEMAQEAARRVEFVVKILSQVRVAMRVGCPF